MPTELTDPGTDNQETQGDAGNDQGSAGRGDAGAGSKDAGGGAGFDWREQIPEEFREEPALANFKDLPSLIKSYVHAQKFIGADKIPIPGKHATEEDWRQIFTRLGLPDSVDKYELKVEEGKELDTEFLGNFKATAHKLGILPAQAQQLLDWFNGSIGEALESNKGAASADNEREMKALKEDWGEAYDDKVQKARFAIKELGDDGLTELLQKEYLDGTPALGNNPAMIRFMAKVGEALGEDAVTGGDNTRPGAKTPAQIQAEITSLTSDPGSPYYDKKHPGHAAAVEEVQALYKRLHPAQDT